MDAQSMPTPSDEESRGAMQLLSRSVHGGHLSSTVVVGQIHFAGLLVGRRLAVANTER